MTRRHRAGFANVWLCSIQQWSGRPCPLTYFLLQLLLFSVALVRVQRWTATKENIQKYRKKCSSQCGARKLEEEEVY